MKTPKKRWTEAEIAELRRDYPMVDNKTLSARFGRNIKGIYHKAATLGLHKSQDYFWSEQYLARCRADHPNKRKHQFKPGHATFNKGKKGGPSCSPKTTFKLGRRPHNTVPVGTKVKDSYGYWKQKIAEPKQWRFCHRMIWEERHGPIPPGHNVVFKDGNCDNLTLENLCCVSQEEHLKRNYHDRYPPEIRQLTQLIGAAQRKINRHEGKNHEDQN